MLVSGSACSGPPAGEREASQGGRVSQLRVSVPLDVGPLNIFTSSDSALNELVYDQLLAPSPYVEEPQPWLAESVRALDPSTWELTLRDDVEWHDGEPFTADDVRFTMEYFKVAPSGTFTHHVSEVPTISRAEVLGPHAIRLTCAFPCPDLGRITLAFIPILPEHVWAGVTEPTKHTALPVGTGPYRLVSYSQARGYRFEANERYFGGRPRVDELVMPIIEDPSTTFTALRTGEIDAAARGVAPELVDDFSGRAGIKVVKTSPLQFLELRFNYQRAPFDVPEFRHALSLAVDREEILDDVLLGQGRPAVNGYPHPDSPWTKPGLSTPFDRQEARRVLDEAGFNDGDGDGVREGRDGRPLAFTVKVSGAEPTHVRAAQLVTGHLAAVGVRVEPVTLDAGAIATLFKTRDFDLSVSTIGAHGVADPTQFIMSHRSGYLWDAPEIPYPEFDALFEEWKATTTIEARTPVLFRMQELFNRQPTSVPLVYPDENWAFRPEGYDGWVESPSYGIVHKWSFLPVATGRRVNAISQEF
ncbi:MAG: ABC transporter substrate-binding protein [Acidimicrobiia bacterium]